MAEMLANMVRTRLFQFGAALFCTALVATQVDIKSLVVRNDPFQPTHTFRPPIHITTAQPSSTPIIWSTEPINIPDYESTTSFARSSSVKAIYVSNYVLDRPTIETPRPEPSIKPPPQPRKTYPIPIGSSAQASSSPRPSAREEHPTGKQATNGTFYSANDTSPIDSGKLKVFQDFFVQIKNCVLGILIDVKDNILINFPGMAPSVGMVAFYQIKYVQGLRREIEELQTVNGMWEEGMTGAVEKFEAVSAAKQVGEQEASQEIARLRSSVLGWQLALAKEQQKSKESLEEKTNIIALFEPDIKEMQRKIANMSAERQQLTDETKGLVKEARDLTGMRDNTIAELRVQLEKASRERRTAEAIITKQDTVAAELREQLKAAQEKTLEAENMTPSDEDQRIKDAEESQRRAEEAARRAKGEAQHLVASQTGQLNKLKAMCNAYRERYGNLDDAEASAAKISSASTFSSAPNVKESGDNQPSVNGAIEGTSQSFAHVDFVSSQSAATLQPSSQDPDGAQGTSSTAAGPSDTCPNPASSLSAHLPGNEQGSGRKKRQHRGKKARSSRNQSQQAEEPAQREVESGDGAGGW